MATECQKVLSSQITKKPPKPKYYTPYIKYDHIFYGKRWYANLVPGINRAKCLIDDYRPEDLQSHLVICYTKQYTIDYMQHLYAVFDSYIEFYNYCIQFPLKDCCFYEVVQFYQKPHFDIDISSSVYIEHYCYDKPYNYDEFFEVGTLLIETLIRACKLVMLPHVLSLEKDVLVYTSHGKSKGKDKLSYHIIINHWCHLDEREAGAFFEKVDHLTACLLEGKYVEWLDKTVYKSRQNFRLVGSHKFDTAPDQLMNRTKKFEPTYRYNGDMIVHQPDIMTIAEKFSNFSKSLVTFTSGCQLLQSFVENKNYVPYDYDITEKDLEDIKVLLEKKFKNQFTVRDIQKHKVYLKKRNPWFCEVCQRVHEHENPVIIVFNNQVKLDCRRNEDGRKLLLGYLVKDVVLEEEVDEGPDYTGNFLSFGDYTVDLTNGDIINCQDAIEDPIKIDDDIINYPNKIDNMTDIANDPDISIKWTKEKLKTPNPIISQRPKRSIRPPPKENVVLYDDIIANQNVLVETHTVDILKKMMIK